MRDKRSQNYIGKVFGELAVIDLSEYRKYNELTWICICDCGELCLRGTQELKSGKAVRCYRHKNKGNFQHGGWVKGKPTKEYACWQGIKGRCLYKSHASYPYYGARGIKICDRWMNSFSNFLKDVGPAPTPRHTIERIDVYGNYLPGNVRWALPEEQVKNRRNSILLENNGEVKTLSEWCRDYKIHFQTARIRYHKGYTFSEILKQP